MLHTPGVGCVKAVCRMRMRCATLQRLRGATPVRQTRWRTVATAESFLALLALIQQESRHEDE